MFLYVRSYPNGAIYRVISQVGRSNVGIIPKPDRGLEETVELPEGEEESEVVTLNLILHVCHCSSALYIVTSKLVFLLFNFIFGRCRCVCLQRQK